MLGGNLIISDSAESPDMNPLVSVIVPCYNSEKTIGRCLAALLDQKTSAPYEVIVVDSSTDTTPHIVREDFPSVRLVRFDQRRFAGAARNSGARAARASICLMVDSDCIVQPDVLERVLARHSEDEYAAVGGALSNGTPRSLSGWIGYLIEFKEFMPRGRARLVESVPTAVVAYRREILERHGFFDETMWLAEDILFNSKIAAAGGKILFDPDIRALHLNRTGWRNILKYQVSMGRMSSIARKRGGLRGGFLLRYPVLILLMPMVRLLNAFKWLARNDSRSLPVFTLVSPLYLLAAAFWSFGFLEEVLTGSLEAELTGG